MVARFLVLFSAKLQFCNNIVLAVSRRFCPLYLDCIVDILEFYEKKWTVKWCRLISVMNCISLIFTIWPFKAPYCIWRFKNWGGDLLGVRYIHRRWNLNEGGIFQNLSYDSITPVSFIWCNLINYNCWYLDLKSKFNPWTILNALSLYN